MSCQSRGPLGARALLRSPLHTRIGTYFPHQSCTDTESRIMISGEVASEKQKRNHLDAGQPALCASLWAAFAICDYEMPFPYLRRPFHSCPSQAVLTKAKRKKTKLGKMAHKPKTVQAVIPSTGKSSPGTPDSSEADHSSDTLSDQSPFFYPGLYCPSGFDLMKILVRSPGLAILPPSLLSTNSRASLVSIMSPFAPSRPSTSAPSTPPARLCSATCSFPTRPSSTSPSRFWT